MIFSKPIKQHLFFTIVAICLAVLFSSSAAAKIIFVPTDYPSVNAAIKAAQKNDTVRVAMGKYSERVDLIPGITLEGGWNSNFTERNIAKNLTILAGSAMGGFSVFGADNTVIDGFVITGGKAPEMMAPNTLIGPGIYANGINITIKNNYIKENNAAGIYLRTCNATIVANVIAANGQAGIFLEQDSAVVIQSNRIHDNAKAGINVGGTELSKILVSHNRLYNNQRAGINATWATGIIRNNIVYENKYAGIRAVTAPMLIVNNTVTNNKLAGISIGEPLNSSSPPAAPLVETNTPADKEKKQQVPEIKNNIITHNGEAGIYANGVGYTYNLLFANNKVNGFHPDFLWYTRLQFGGYEDMVSLEKSKNILADPLFVNPAQHDYHLKSGSPAIDSGDPDVRFNDSNFGPSLGADQNDMGAYGGPSTFPEERPTNITPKADIAPPEQRLYAGDKITLDGTVSSDPNGDKISYSWQLQSKPRGSTATLSATTKEKTELSFDKGGTYTVQLAVVDRWGLQSSPKTIRLVVGSDKPPTAKINKQSNPAKVGETVKLSAYYNKKKYKDKKLTFFWQFRKKPSDSKTSLDKAYTAKPTFVLDSPGCYTVQLMVGNDQEYSEPDIAHICSQESRSIGKRIVPDEYPTIQTALDTAEVNDQVIVNAGVYKERIIIDKVVDLIGVGWPVIDGGGNDNNDATVFICYLDNKSAGKMHGFVVTGGGSGIFGHGLQILNSSPEVFNNKIRDNKHVGIGIHGHKRFTEKAKIHDNLIFDNAIGVSHGLGTYGEIYENVIYNNKVAGIGVRGLSKPILRRNTIYNNYVGIGVREEAYPRIEDNKIRNNTIGIALNPGSNAMYTDQESKIEIKNNEVYNNRQCGIFISSLHRNGIESQGNIIKKNNTVTPPLERSGGVVVGYPHESLAKIFLRSNTIEENNGKNIQQFKPMADSFGEIGNSKNRRPF